MHQVYTVGSSLRRIIKRYNVPHDHNQKVQQPNASSGLSKPKKGITSVARFFVFKKKYVIFNE
jgi:hypothetical protein